MREKETSKPVSYTHLDVYKRQNKYFGLPCAKHSDEPPTKQEACSPVDSTLPGVSSP